METFFEFAVHHINNDTPIFIISILRTFKKSKKAEMEDETGSYVLKTNTDFDGAVRFQSYVLVHKGDKSMGYGRVIKHTPKMVYCDGRSFRKEGHIFTVRPHKTDIFGNKNE
jgi:hypothetical protein